MTTAKTIARKLNDLGIFTRVYDNCGTTIIDCESRDDNHYLTITVHDWKVYVSDRFREVVKGRVSSSFNVIKDYNHKTDNQLANYISNIAKKFYN